MKFAPMIALAIIACSCIACGDADRSPVSADSQLERAYLAVFTKAPPGPAIVSGCEWTDELGNVIGGWGTTRNSQGTAVQNPTLSGTRFRFDLRDNARALWWLERAYAPWEAVPWDQYEQVSGATIVSGYRPVLRVWSGEFSAGANTITWDCLDQNGERVPDGYYRIYLSTTHRLVWVDVLVLSDPADLYRITGLSVGNEH